jgi:hypothetical protein
MTYDTSFGQRLAAIWQELVEHLNAITREQIAASPEPHQPGEGREDPQWT